jgi:hypothetical protein
MKKFVTILSVMFFCLTALSQQASALGTKINVQAAVVQPMGDFSLYDSTSDIGGWGGAPGLGIGVMVGLELDLAIIVGTIRTGYVYHLPTTSATSQEEQTWSNIPVLIGLRYKTPTPGIAFFLGAEGALNKLSLDGTTYNDSATLLGMNAYLGANIGPIEVTAGLNVLELKEFSETKTLMFTVGYDLFSLP